MRWEKEGLWEGKTGLEETGGKCNWSLISACSVPLTQPMTENINK